MRNLAFFVFYFIFPNVAVFGTDVVAHRGGAAEAVENTLEAFSHAIACGSDWIELDVRLSKDGVPIVVHDASTKRFWKGPVRKFSYLSLEEIKKLTTKNELALTIPTLEETLELTAGKVGIMLDIKAEDATSCSLFVKAVLEALSPYEEIGKESCMLSSFQPEILQEIRRQDPSKKICLIAHNETLLRFIDILNPEMVSVHMDLLDQDFLNKMHSLGTSVWSWTVNRKWKMKECIEMGVDGVVTDWPRLLCSLVKNRS